ncbi:hypothetical protein ACET3X_005690 [Alternaria dauci]|uniref:Uncharacterized protein n=1 Tax=Alternaria dauci TaxID=48095 RepID=A0ABR3UG57_9PLEO
MATYYHYDSEGKVTVSAPHPTDWISTSGPSVANEYEQRGDIVGAFLARRAMAYPALGVPEALNVYGASYYPAMSVFEGDADCESSDQSHLFSEADEDSRYTASSSPNTANTVGWAGWAFQSGVPQPYPNPEDIRHLHTLHSLLPYLQPERRLNAFNGPVVDIIDQDTGFALAYQVPKKMLILFLGRQVVNKFIRTIHREDDENWKGAPTSQEMHLPRGVASQASVKILVAWMFRACQYHTMNTMKQIRVPTNTFAACSLARTMELFELHKDALRVDHFIAATHFTRPIFAVELETLWNCMGEESRYVYAAINAVSQRLRAFDAGSTGEATTGIDADMLAMLKKHPDLEARVRDPKLNDQHRPYFSTQWIKKLEDKTSDNPHHDVDESKKNYGKSTPQGSRGKGPAKDSDEKSQLLELETTARKFSVLRIVPGTTEPADSDAEKCPEADQATR